jgi:hypothetical protein
MDPIGGGLQLSAFLGRSAKLDMASDDAQLECGRCETTTRATYRKFEIKVTEGKGVQCGVEALPSVKRTRCFFPSSWPASAPVAFLEYE